MSRKLYEALDAVVDEATFIHFAKILHADRVKSDKLEATLDGFQGEWANNDVAGFLEGALAWAEDSDFGVRPGPKSTNPWQLFASFLWGGRSYE